MYTHSSVNCFPSVSIKTRMVPTFNTKLSCLSLSFVRLRMSPFTSCFQCNMHEAWYGLAPPHNQGKGGRIMSMTLATLVLCMWHQLTTWKRRRMSCWRTTTVTTNRKPAMQKRHLVLCTSSKNNRLCLAFTVLQQLERTERLLCSTETLAKICILLLYIQLHINWPFWWLDQYQICHVLYQVQNRYMYLTALLRATPKETTLKWWSIIPIYKPVRLADFIL